MRSADRPDLSVIVVVVSDTVDRTIDAAPLRRSLRALGAQRGGARLEIIVPHVASDAVAGLAPSFPEVTFLRVDDLVSYGASAGREHHDELRARGLALARADVVGLLEDHGVADAGWAEAALALHRDHPDAGAIGGAIENQVDRPLNWAAYFCDFLRYHEPPAFALSVSASDANVTYKRAALAAVAPVWKEIFHETAVHDALTRAGWRIAVSAALVVRQDRAALTVGRSLSERFVWGRSYAGTRSRLIGAGRRCVLAAASPLLPLLLLRRMAATALRQPGLRGAFVRALPATIALATAWSVGEAVGYVTGRAHGGGTPAADAIGRAIVSKG